jgi:hypothetical protein
MTLTPGHHFFQTVEAVGQSSQSDFQIGIRMGRFHSDINVIKFSSSALTMQQNKLECFSLVALALSSLAQYLR